MLLDELITAAATATPDRVALICGPQRTSYAALRDAMESAATQFASLIDAPGTRIAVWMEKRLENVAACFGATAAGAIFVPINPVLKPAQVAHIVQDCDVAVLVTTASRLDALAGAIDHCASLRHAIVVDAGTAPHHNLNFRVHDWLAGERTMVSSRKPSRCETDVAAIFYTSGSTGRPKGVVLSHRNLLAGAQSVASYLDNCADDVLLGALPLTFDAGFSQLTTAFLVGARVVLHNYLLPRDALVAMAEHQVTGLTAVPPLYAQLIQAKWPADCANALRYFASTGGRMPKSTLMVLRELMPNAKPYLMYGLTEAFRSTFLPPEQIDVRPDSIGRAIPNAEIQILRADGSRCAPFEHGELVHRGPLVALGYWNNPEATGARFRELPRTGLNTSVPGPEIAVFSGDEAYCDNEGFLYFVGRKDEMLKTSGYRVSPTEIEEVLYASGLPTECAAFGVDNDVLGQSIHAVVMAAPSGENIAEKLRDHCRQHLPAYMVPAVIHVQSASLPRNPNGKVDRRALIERFAGA